ncbi:MULTISPECIES: glycoside hydrolase family 3 N-terminal domain-containing protein [Dysgonomonas]|uniref:glycoside hydrolase family 3 N-terminal domain-containing protein n=1 Tax=Dysgonomonas TaxID=156973 RepID=UPI0009294EC3|nr:MULTISPECIES: glycoside hydrolase family 3 N-terminal domain-containing protein [Dysgonomonas]MBN9301051.1 serine hydrolase [Dysgonomonas mossii]OJX58185.1 MAG: glycoside hydrolase [Dysgonomonas sp. 37-18]
MKIKYIAAATAFFATICLNVAALGSKTTTLYDTVDKEKMGHWVDSVYNQMSLDERIGQLFMPIVSGDNTESNKNTIKNLITSQYVGGLLFSKGSPQNQAELTNYAQQVAKTPLMISLDGEWGLSMRLDNTTQFPRNMMLGAIQNDSLLYYYGLEVARQCRQIGVQVNFAPALDVNSNPNNPVIGNRSFGEDPDRVAQLGIMYSKGLEAGGVMAVAKHFPGHGDTSTDSHKTLPTITHDKERLDDFEIKPFRKYIDAGLSGMMIGHLNIPALDPKRQPSSLSEPITTKLLQNDLGFSGLIFTDGLQMKGVSGEDNYCVRALLAGNDVLLGPVNTAKEFNAVKKAIADTLLTESQIEVKCKKVLAYKYILGLNHVTTIEASGLIQSLNNANAEWINRNLHRDAMTLIKDDDKIVPLKELDKRKIAAISIGASVDNTFHSILKMYGDVTCFNVSDSDALLQLKKVLEPYNTIIVSVHTTRTNFSTAIQNVMQGKETVLVFFLNPYRVAAYASAVKNADGVLLAYEDTDLSQNYAAQAIFGGNAITGKAPVTVKGVFKEGKGINTKKIRLSYNVPEDVGIATSRLDGIETIVQEGIKAQAFPGCQILIAKDGEVIYNKSFGSFEYDGKQKVTNTDLYDLASMTKATATVPAVMKLYDDAKLKLNTPISNYVSALKGTDKSDITVRDALLHESRLPAFIPYYMNAIDEDSYEGKLFNRTQTSLYSAQFDANTWARTDYKFKPSMVSQTPKAGFLPLAEGLYINETYSDTIISEIAKSKLSKRKQYVYSCLNFMLLKEVVEKISKEDLNTFVEENFFSKLGATTTTYNPLTKFDKQRIVPTEKDDFLRKQLLQGYVHDEGAAFMGGISGNAGLFSDANDIAKLYQMWLNMGTYGGEEYLSPKTCQLFLQAKSGISRRGLGFDKPETTTGKSSPTALSAPAGTYGHTGFTGTCFWVDPDNNLIYIFLSNRVNDKRTHNAISTLNIRTRIQEEIYSAMKKGTVSQETNITNTNTNDKQKTDAE